MRSLVPLFIGLPDDRCQCPHKDTTVFRNGVTLQNNVSASVDE